MKSITTLIVVILIVVITLIYGTAKNQEAKANSAKIPEPVREWNEEINTYSEKFDVPASLAYSILWQESAGNPNATGSAGEIGLMQLKPIAVKDVQGSMGVNTAGWKTNPVKNIEVGVAYLKLMYDRTGNWQEAVRAYNQGKRGKDLNKDRSGKADNYLSSVTEKRKFFT